MKFHAKKFNELTLKQLYQILKLRFDIFVLEQKSFYPEYDYKDYLAHHLFFEHKGKIIAYVRIRKDSKKKAHLARVVVHKGHRGKGLGAKIVKLGIEHSKSRWGSLPIEIGAQKRLEKFYSSFGFKRIGKVYDEGGIPHITMVLRT